MFDVSPEGCWVDGCLMVFLVGAYRGLSKRAVEPAIALRPSRYSFLTQERGHCVNKAYFSAPYGWPTWEVGLARTDGFAVKFKHV